MAPSFMSMYEACSRNGVDKEKRRGSGQASSLNVYSALVFGPTAFLRWELW